ncbi:nucleotide-diphospho-sugar transferase [Scheffersomyces coipomensis]|uniref:nucleotide-diphospho-sugar transferase n=1 Tax=Scheffersomyces coipomensis TaxID=1788519 RepID=UPI00315C829A
MSERIISSKIDAPFQLGCKAPDSSQSRANAGFVVLARNSELNDVIKSIKSMERHFNQWYNYPWIFLNDEEFNDDFKTTVQQYTNAKVEFGKIPIEEWNFKSNVDKQEFNEYIHGQGDRGIMYGNLESYHKMCRFYSGFFYKHELVSKLDWYWRVEPDVEFYCDLTYDPFIEMEKRGKKYGFTVLIHELYYTIPGLFRETRSFINKHNIKVGSAWNLFIHDSKYTNGINQNDYDNINNKFEILKELEENINLEIFLKLKKKKEKHLKRFNPDLLKKLTRLSTKKPSLYEDRIDREEYNLCHFWSNFEIARTDLFTSPEYQNFFNHLEQSGGFYKERWGDAPIHSLAVGMMLDLKDIHYFRDIGYRHSTIKHCPNVGVGCRCRCPSNHRDIEDSSSTCMNKWKELTSDTFSPFEPIDLEYWEKEITKRVEIYLANGGDFGYSNIVETLYEQGKL